MYSSIPYKNPALSPGTRTEDLLARMTLTEKLAQMTLVCMGKNENLENAGGAVQPRRADVGAVLSWLNRIERNEIQRRAVEQTRLGIPIMFAADIVHGCETVYPIPLAQACSFNPDLVKKACSMAAVEARAKGLNWTFAPMLDVPRDPRWGRVMESFGEDPHLTSIMGAASMLGYQTDRLGGDVNSIAACPKHFLGYAESEGGRDYQYADVSLRALHEVHLPPFRAAIDAGAATVMSAFSDLGGLPATCNRFILEDILRGQLGFDGFVVSDWCAVQELVNHGVAESAKEAAKRAVDAGVDMDMVDGVYEAFLGRSLDDGNVLLDAVDEAVRRILRVKFRLGLFDRPYEDGPNDSPQRTAYHRQIAKELARESFVLLKNANHLLPLNLERISRVAVVGPAADADMYSAWVPGRLPENVTTIVSGIADRAGRSCQVGHAKGCNYVGSDTSGFAEAMTLASSSDVVILCLGEPGTYSGENRSRACLDLPGVQLDLLNALRTTGKPAVVLMSNGRPLALEAVAEHADALLEIWMPGVEAGSAVADILFGDASPSGKLAMTFPRNVGQIPIYYAQRRSGRPGKGEYIDSRSDPLFEFGFGLSYTSFEYSDITLDSPSCRRGETITASVDVTNVGAMSAKETVLWYIQDHVSSLTRPSKELKHFEKKEIPPGASRTFSFEIDPERDLSFRDAHGTLVLEPGVFSVWVGKDRAAELTLSSSTVD